jgi:O-antigen/teichoic acid export membrane protein
MNIKRSRTRTTRWNIFFQYSTLVYYFVIAILLVPLYLENIEQEVYGYWLATGNIVAWLSIVDPGFSMVMQQKISSSYGSGKIIKVGAYIGSGIVLSVVFLSFVSALGFYFYASFESLLDSNLSFDDFTSLKESFYYALIGSILMILSYSLNGINQGLQSSLGIGLIYSLANTAGIILTWLMLVNGYGVLALGIAMFIRSLIYVFGNLAYLIYRICDERITISMDIMVFKEFKSLMSYNFLGRIGGIINGQMSIYVAATVVSAVEVTRLKFTQTIPEMSKLILVKPIVALMPSLSHLLGEGEIEKSKKILILVIKLILWGTGFAFGFFFLFNEKFILLWIGEKYYAGDKVNLLVVILLLVTIITNSFAYLVFAMGNIKNNNVVVFAQAILFIPLLWLGGKYYGLIGVVLAALLAEVLVPLWYYPRNLFTRLNLSSFEIKRLLNEFAIVLSIDFIIILFFTQALEFNVRSWIDLLFSISTYVLLFFGILYFLSYDFRLFIKDRMKIVYYKVGLYVRR